MSRHWIRPYIRSVTHCPNCGKSVDKHPTGASALDMIVSSLTPVRIHVRRITEKLDELQWNCEDVPSCSLIVDMARYALGCRGVTGLGINKMATKIAGSVMRRAKWRLPPEKDD